MVAPVPSDERRARTCLRALQVVTRPQVLLPGLAVLAGRHGPLRGRAVTGRHWSLL